MTPSLSILHAQHHHVWRAPAPACPRLISLASAISRNLLRVSPCGARAGPPGALQTPCPLQSSGAPAGRRHRTPWPSPKEPALPPATSPLTLLPAAHSQPHPRPARPGSPRRDAPPRLSAPLPREGPRLLQGTNHTHGHAPSPPPLPAATERSDFRGSRRPPPLPYASLLPACRRAGALQTRPRSPPSLSPEPWAFSTLATAHAPTLGWVEAKLCRKGGRPRCGGPQEARPRGWQGASSVCEVTAGSPNVVPIPGLQAALGPPGSRGHWLWGQVRQTQWALGVLLWEMVRPGGGLATSAWGPHPSRDSTQPLADKSVPTHGCPVQPIRAHHSHSCTPNHTGPCTQGQQSVPRRVACCTLSDHTLLPTALPPGHTQARGSWARRHTHAHMHTARWHQPSLPDRLCRPMLPCSAHTWRSPCAHTDSCHTHSPAHTWANSVHIPMNEDTREDVEEGGM